MLEPQTKAKSRTWHSYWVQRKTDPASEKLIEKFGPLLGQVLWSRGYSEIEAAENFLDPKLENIQSPLKLRDIEKAATRLLEAREKNEAVCIYADYDLDGICGLALLKSFFKSVGFENLSSYQPERLKEGYGVHPDALIELANRGVKVLVTVDTGIGAKEAAEKARELGITLIITDHHKQISKLPDAYAVVNPNQEADDSGLSYLSGTGVAFYLCMTLRMLMRRRALFEISNIKEPDLRDWLDLFALASIADCVDLVGDNRALVRSGLHYLAKSSRIGLRLLIQSVLYNPKTLSVRDVAFSIAPKLNAASRMGKAQLSTELLLCEDLTQAQMLVEEVLKLNETRAEIQSQVYSEAEALALTQVNNHNPPVVVVSGPWHEGVLGIVAAKLVEKFGRPAVVLSEHGEAALRGSMRSKAYFSCVKALDSCVEILAKYGGHKMAAGLQLAPKMLDAFTAKLWESSHNFVSGLAQKIEELDSVSFDGNLDKEPSLKDVEDLYRMAPFGQGNEDPKFLIKNLEIKKAQIIKGQHYKWQVFDSTSAIGFFKSSEIEAIMNRGLSHIDALVVPEITVFKGQRNVQLRLQHVRAAQNDYPDKDTSL